MPADRYPDVLVVAAHLPELLGLRPWLGNRLRGEIAAVRVSAEAVGIGLPAAAGAIAAALDRNCPRAVVLIGTCGAYDGRRLNVGDVVVARRVHLASAAVALGQGAFPAPMSIAVDATPALREKLGGAGVRAVAVATTLAITVDDWLAATLAKRESCDVEHLEAFAVAERAASEGVPFAIVLGVANLCGAHARDQWMANQRRAADGAARHVAAWLERGAPGLGARGRRAVVKKRR
jgi:nucleoside phosphorylase